MDEPLWKVDTKTDYRRTAEVGSAGGCSLSLFPSETDGGARTRAAAENKMLMDSTRWYGSVQLNRIIVLGVRMTGCRRRSCGSRRQAGTGRRTRNDGSWGAETLLYWLQHRLATRPLIITWAVAEAVACATNWQNSDVLRKIQWGSRCCSGILCKLQWHIT